MKKIILGLILIIAFSTGSYVVGGKVSSNEIKLEEKQRLLGREFQLLTSILNDIEHEQMEKALGKIEAIRYIGLHSNFTDNPNGLINYCIQQLKDGNIDQLKVVLLKGIEILEPGSKFKASSNNVHATLDQWNLFLNNFPF